MRVLDGTRVVEDDASIWHTRRAAHERLVIDVGTGDGRYPYENARRDPTTLYVGLDPDAEAMGEYAFRAGRKPARGGAANVLYVVVSLEALPPEALAAADLVTVVFPWSGLLRGLVRPEPDALEALATLAKPGGAFELTLCYDPQRDAAAFGGEVPPPLDDAYIDAVLLPAYASAGLVIDSKRRMTVDEALAMPSTWGRRLLHGRARDVFRLEGHRAADAGAPGASIS